MQPSPADIERGKRIADRRKMLGLTQKQVADCCGVYTTSVSNWERGKNRPEEKLIALARALKTDPDWLDNGIDWFSDLKRITSWLASWQDGEARDDFIRDLFLWRLAQLTQEQGPDGQFRYKLGAKKRADKWLAGLGLEFHPQPGFLRKKPAHKKVLSLKERTIVPSQRAGNPVDNEGPASPAATLPNEPSREPGAGGKTV